MNKFNIVIYYFSVTHGLTLEYFTFRKEPIGCGEPSEIIRKARSNTKSLQ